MHGPYKGTSLERLPATQTVWSKWRSLYPDTKVLGRFDNVSNWHDTYDSYYQTGHGIMHQHNGPLHFGLAVILAREQKLYPFAEVEKTTLVQDRVAGLPVLVVLEKATRTAVAFEARVQGKDLEFEPAKDLILHDRGTKSQWAGLTGKCLEGPLKGTALRQLTTTLFVAENWRLHYPDGKVYQASQGK